MPSDLQKPQNSAPFLLNLISKQQIDPKQLTTHQRRICVRYLLQDMKHTQTEIATIMKVDNGTVTRDKQKIMKQNSWYVDDIDERKWVIDLIQTAEVASARLFRNGKPKEAFDVKVKTIETLQSLGYITKKPLEVDLTAQMSFQELLKRAAEIKPDPRAEALATNRIN